ncbi:MAG: hypothetical protein AAFR04_07985, partial [Pseudomonadota bacterium]
MPNLNIRDAKNRDAVVRGEPTTQTTRIHQVGPNGSPTSLRRVLKGTLEHDLKALLAAHGDSLDEVAQALIDGDPDVDMERFGSYLTHPARVWVNDAD